MIVGIDQRSDFISKFIVSILFDIRLQMKNSINRINQQNRLRKFSWIPPFFKNEIIY